MADQIALLIKKTENKASKKQTLRSHQIPHLKSFRKQQKHLAPVISIAFCWPLQKGTFWLSSRFGPRLRSKKRGSAKFEMHHGLDMAASTGTPIKSAYAGIVHSAQYNKGYGNCIVVYHGDGISTRYAHLSALLVQSGDQVTCNDIIGKVGSTGNTRGNGDGSHLHFEVIIHGKRYDPLFYLV